MMKSIINILNFKSENKIASIEIYFDGNIYEFRILIFHKKNAEIELSLESIQKQNIAEETIKELSDIPIILIISGKNIIYKKELKEAELTIYTNNSDLYLTKIKQENYTFTNIIRKVKIEECIDKVYKLKNNIIRLDIGVFGLQQINSVAHTPYNSIILDNIRISFNKNTIEEISEKIDIDTDNPIIEIAGISIQKKLMLGLISVINESNESLIDNIHSDEITWIEENKQRHQTRIRSNTLKKGIFISYVTILLALGVFFFLIKKKNIKLEHQLKHLIEEKKNIQEKEKKGNNNIIEIWPKKTQHAFYADRIANTLPSKISLIELNINPLLLKESKNSKEFVFNINCIELKGTCSSAIELNQWLTTLKKQQWVEKIEVIEYKWNTITLSGFFELKITI